MNRETITKRQAFCIVVTFIIGSLILANLSKEAEQDTWITLLMAAAGFILLSLIYARLIKLYPGMDIFQIIEALFGKVVAKVITVLLLWYSIHLFGLVIRNFSEFVQIIAMPETPQLPLMLLMLLIPSYIAKSGVESLGKWAVATLPLIFFVVILDVFLSLNKMEFSNIEPVFTHDLGALATGAFDMFMFPFAETVLFLGIANAIKQTDSPRRIFIFATVAGTAFMLIILLRNLEVLGVPMMMAQYFPSYMTVRVINIGNVITRIEGSVSMNYILLGFAKGTVCLMFAAKGTASLFGVKDYKKLVMPAGLLSLALAAIVYKSTMEMFSFFKIYTYYALPFEIIIPIIMWITAEIKKKKMKTVNIPVQS